MSDPHLNPDRFAGVAHGLARWSAVEAAHLERCAECRLEWELVRAARTLGRSRSGEIDAGRVAETVVRRLGTEPAPGARARHGAARWMVGLAAAAAIALAVFLPPGEPASGRKGVAAAEIAVLHELDGLTPAQLEAVLEDIPPTADAAIHVEAAPIGELTVPDLERMLRSME